MWATHLSAPAGLLLDRVTAAFLPRTLPRLLRALLLLSLAVALFGTVRVAAKYGSRAVWIVRSGALGTSAWPIPTAELKPLLPPFGRIGFATDLPDQETIYRHAHIQNRLAPLVVLREFEGDPPLRGARRVVINFIDPQRETTFCAAQGVTIVARCSSGLAVGERKR